MNNSRIKRVMLIVSVGVLVVLTTLGIMWYMRSPNVSEPEIQVNNSPADDPPIAERLAAWNKVNRPDIYILNQLPIQQPTFDLTGDVAEDGKITFTVKLKTISLQEVQEGVNAWLLSTGLTQEQIDTLVIEYDASIN